MLHKETVDRSTLELLVQLHQKEYLKGFYLVGGTALALKMGHRKSVLIDLFSNFSFDTAQMLENPKIKVGNSEEKNHKGNQYLLITDITLIIPTIKQFT